MGITSIYFVLLSIISIFIFYLLNPRIRIVYLALIGCGFILSYNYYLIIYVIIYSLINYYFGIIIPLSRFKRTLFRAGIVFNLAQLAVLK